MRLCRKSTLGCIASLQLSGRSGSCFGFQVANYGPSLQHGNMGLSSFRRPTTNLFERKDNDDGGENSDKPYKNNLDIFGEPEDKPKRNEWDEEGDVRGSDRIKSCIPYILPLIDGDNFGKYIYERIPPLDTVHYVFIRPIVEGFQSAPILIILLFIIFALGPQLTGQSREVRFNAQQAILIDVALIFPSLLGEAVAEADANLPRAIMEPSSNFVWYFYVSLVIYCVTSNLRGKRPDQIPFFSGIADTVIGPF
ncbi:hypothetical protein ACHAXR_001691 [Thalassiosira sp. AJA248-18]